MSMGGGQEVKETEEEKESARIAGEQYDRWKERFLPLESEMIADVKDTAPERRRALGLAGASTTRAFAEARPRVEAAQTAAGARPGSSRFNLGIAGLGRDEGSARGSSAVAANNAIDDQYYAGLNTLTSLGRGQQVGALSGLSDIANASTQQASFDAGQAAENRAGWASAIGTAAGGITSAYFDNQDRKAKKPKTPFDPQPVQVPSLDYNIPDVSFGSGSWKWR